MIDEDVDMQRLKSATDKLAEHFDSVQIFVTRVEDGDEGTTTASWGSGNYFARKGQIQEWILKQDEITKIQIHKQEED